MARVLIIEDEEDLASLLEYNLKTEGYEVLVVHTAAAGIARLKTFKPELVLLDLMLPDVSGVDVARTIRDTEELKNTAVIMVTARGEESDRIRGLELGADDYVVKPFSVKELLLRVKAVLRRHEHFETATADTLTQGEVVLDSVRHEVRVKGQPVLLTKLEFRLLKTFLSRPGRVQTRETLLADVWDIEADVTTRTVDTHIKRLRERLGAAGELIETIRGVGYRLVGK